MASSPRLSPDRAGSSCPPGAIAKLHRDSQTYNESAVRFGPGEMEPPYRPGEVGPEDQFAAAIPSCALRQESLSLTARARPVPAGSRLKTRSGRNDQWRLMNDERGSTSDRRDTSFRHLDFEHRHSLNIHPRCLV